MGNIIDSCITCRKNEQTEDESDPPVTRTPTNILDEYNFIKVYDTSPYEKYEKIETLGQGAFGLVLKVCLKTNNEIVRAMKIINIKNVKQDQPDKLLDEIKIVGKLQHPNIMKIYEYYKYNEKIYIISEFYDQGDLLGKIENMNIMNEFVVRYLMRQILDAVKALHENSVFHGDIKLENIMVYKTLVSRKEDKRITLINKDLNSNKELQNELENNPEKNTKILENISYYEIKIIDFGCSKYLKRKKRKIEKRGNNDMLKEIVGTSAYCSPEVINNLYDEKSDEWSCGVLMYILLCHDLPFKGDTEEEIFKNVKKYNVDFNRNEFNNISKECKDLMKRLLDPDKDRRVTAADALKHPFFANNLDPKRILTRNKDLSLLKKFLKIEKYPSILHKIVIAYCCYHYLDKAEEKYLNELFRHLDSKNKNKLSFHDFKEGFKEAKIPISDFELNRILEISDTDGSKFIENHEFLRALCDKDKLLNDKNLKNVFNDIDKYKKGYINIDDLKNFIMRCNKKKSEDSDFKIFIKDFRINEDSKIYFDQFRDYIRNTKTEDIITKRTNSFAFNADGVNFIKKYATQGNENKKNE